MNLRNTFYVALAFFCLGVAGFALSYLFGFEGFLSAKGSLPNDLDWQIAFHAHLIGGAIALGLGWLQFLPKLRKNKPILHRNIGKVYLASILVISAPAAMYLAPNAIGSIWNSWGFGLMAISWFCTSIAGLWYIRKGQVTIHQKWMIRSFALTLAAVSLRIQLPTYIISGYSFELAYSIVAWSCWVPNLFIAEWIIRKKI